MNKRDELLQERYNLTKKLEKQIEKIGKREWTAEERKNYDADMTEIDRLGEEAHVAGEDRAAQIRKLLTDVDRIPAAGIIENIGVDDRSAGSQGYAGRDKVGNEFRVWHPGETIAPYRGKGYESEARLWKTLESAITGKFDELTPEERGLASGSLSGGGVVVPDNWAREIIQAARPNMTSAQIADIVELPGGNLVIPGVSGLPTASWVGEGGTFAESDDTYFGVKLNAHKVGCYSMMSIELADFASGIEAQISSDLTAAVGLAVDKGFYEGTGVNQPLGLKNVPNINSTDAAGGAVILDDYVKNAYWALQILNAPRNVFMVSHPQWFRYLDILKLVGAGLLYAFTGSPATMPSSLSNITQLMSANLRCDTNVSDVYTLPRGAAVLGYAPGGARIEVFRGSDTAVKTGQVYVRIYLMMDSGVRMPAWCHCYKNVLVS